VDGHNGDLITIRQVDTFQSSVAVGEGVDSFICQVVYSDQTYPPEFGQACQFENGHVREQRTI
jgi:hypothetical protein